MVDRLTVELVQETTKTREKLDGLSIPEVDLYPPSMMDDCLRWPYRGVDSPTSGQPTGENYWWWMADKGLSWNTVNGYQALTGANVNNADKFVMPQGGPYYSLDGATEYLWYADSAWQHFGADPALVWMWANAAIVGAGAQVIVGKQDNNNQRSWVLTESGAGVWRFYVSNNGIAQSWVSSTVALATGWHFFGVYFQPGALQNIYVGAASSDALTKTRQAAGVVAAAFNSNAPFSIGHDYNVGVAQNLWNGDIGIGGYWNGVPTTESLIDAWMNWIFQRTRYFYGGLA